jgi:hypothetical protein
MEENCMKRLIGMTMLLVTLFLVLKHVENPSLPFSAPHMPPSLHPLPLPARLLFFSPDDDDGKVPRAGGRGGQRVEGTHKWRRNELKKCNKKCAKEYSKNREDLGTEEAQNKREACFENCKLLYGDGVIESHDITQI